MDRNQMTRRSRLVIFVSITEKQKASCVLWLLRIWFVTFQRYILVIHIVFSLSGCAKKDNVICNVETITKNMWKSDRTGLVTILGIFHPSFGILGMGVRKLISLFLHCVLWPWPLLFFHNGQEVDDSAFLSCCANLEITSYSWTMHFEEDVKRVGRSLPDRLTGCLTLTEHSNPI